MKAWKIIKKSVKFIMLICPYDIRLKGKPQIRMKFLKSMIIS